MLTEDATRTQLIDTQLALAGWDVADPTQVVEEYPVDPSSSGGVGSMAVA